MSINLNKEEKKSINLTKSNPALTNVVAKLWWNVDENSTFDLDVSAFMLKKAGAELKLLSDAHFVFYNNERSPDGSVWKTPDERKGGTEELFINIKDLPVDVVEISIVVTIDKAIERNQTFGQIKEAGIKIINGDSNEELAFYDIDASGHNNTALHVGSFYKRDDEFAFAAVGSFFELGLADCLKSD